MNQAPPEEPADSRDPLQEPNGAELLQLLAEEMKHRGIQILSVRNAKGGFLVTTQADGSPVEQWYSISEIRGFRK
jgi:hypothetical protein